MSNNPPVDQSQFQRIDELADRFEEAWKAHSNDPEAHRQPRIEEYLKDVSEADRSEVRKELIRVEVQCRMRGEQPTAEEYLSRFPEDGPALCSLFPDDPRLRVTIAAAGQNRDDRDPPVAAAGEPTIDKTGLPVLRRFGGYLLLRAPPRRPEQESAERPRRVNRRIAGTRGHGKGLHGPGTQYRSACGREADLDRRPRGAGAV